MTARVALARDALPGQAGGGSLNLIHTNNCSNPASMRLTARFDFPNGVSLAEAQRVIDFAFGPLGELMLRRGLDGRR